MNVVINQLESNLNTFKSLLSDVDANSVLWRTLSDKWCLLEILCHLYDEERDDFRFRTQWVLEKPGEAPPPFNPLDWIEDHKYMEQDYKIMMSKFLSERKASIVWLKQLKNPNWDHYYDHPKAGKLTASYFLNNWLAHDYLHMRQIIKLKFDYLKSNIETSLDYAGTW